MKKLYYLVLSILLINCGEPTLEDRISEAKKNRHFHDNTGWPIGIDVTDDDEIFLLNGEPLTGTIYKEYKTGDLRWEKIFVDGIEHQYIKYDNVELKKIEKNLQTLQSAQISCLIQSIKFFRNISLNSRNVLLTTESNGLL